MPSESPFSINAGRISTTSPLAVRHREDTPHTAVTRRAGTHAKWCENLLSTRSSRRVFILELLVLVGMAATIRDASPNPRTFINSTPAA
jgi:hypothetical protein